MASTRIDKWYETHKHDPEVLAKRAQRSRDYRSKVGRDVLREQERSQNDLLRDKVLDQYGRKCGICGFDTDQRILQIDHINGGGNQERRAIGVRGIRRKALSNPEVYQLLCPNCNWTKRYDLDEQNHKSDSSITTSARLIDGAGTKE